MGRTVLGRVADLDRQSRRDEPRRKLRKKNRKSLQPSPAPEEKPAEPEREEPATVAVRIDDPNCLICQEPVGQTNPEGITETWSILPCGHIFGSYCIKRYLGVAADDQPLCPICRSLAHHDICGHPVLPFVLRPDGSHPDLVVVDAASGRVRPPTSLDDLNNIACKYCRDLEERRKRRQRRLERRQQRLQQQQEQQQGQQQEPQEQVQQPTPAQEQKADAQEQHQLESTPQPEQAAQTTQPEEQRQPVQESPKQPEAQEVPKASSEDDTPTPSSPSTPIKLKQPWRWLRALDTLRKALHIRPRTHGNGDADESNTNSGQDQTGSNTISTSQDPSNDSSSSDSSDDEDLTPNGTGGLPRLTRIEARQRRRTQATNNGVWQGPWVDVPTRDVEWEKWWKVQVPCGV
ncbi:hypothetical protein VTJ04DRAFT_7863 [Mycothermus thermophilus]|uniref:uncharacterized protein n=1 Tax=Humicola insolens TaxID=85995 RepID=UPI003742140E